MKKEELSGFFNSSDGKVNIMLLALVLLIFAVILSVSFVMEAMPVDAKSFNITPMSPTDLSINGTRKINFTFIVNLNGSGDDIIANCSIWTNITGTWQRELTNTSTGNSSNITNSTSEVSWMNITFSGSARDGNFSWGVQCVNVTGDGNTDRYNGSNFSINRTLYIDSAAPKFILDTPKGNLSLGTNLNITSNATAVFYINVSDNSTHSVWYILNNLPTIIPVGSTNESLNRTMTLDRTVRGDLRMYNVSIALLLNFTNNFTGPGPHSVTFCANDTTGRRNCSAPVDFIVRGVSCSGLERQFGAGDVSHPGEGHTFLGMDIRYGNGTDFPTDDFLDPVNINLSFVVNFTTDQGIIIVGARIDAANLGNASNTNYSNSISGEARAAAGSGLRSNLTWTDVKSFIPTDISYEFGIIAFRNTFAKMMFCNGTSISNPGCFNVGQCNATNFNIYNHTRVIPINSACWLTNGSWGVENGSESNLPSIPRGFTYLFVDHFSGGLGASDFGSPEIQFFGNLINGETGRTRKETPTDTASIFNTTRAVVINFTVTDLNSTGINMTINGTINVSVKPIGSLQGTNADKVYYSGKNLTCDPVGLLGNETISNITGSDTNGNLSGINCTVTVTLSNGTYNITVQAKDTSNNSNINITSIRITIDNIAPVFVYYNFTNSSAFNLSGADPGSIFYNASYQVGSGDGVAGLGDDASRTQSGKNRNIFAIANWTDNLTQPLRGLFQFYNTSNSSWKTMNESPARYSIMANNSWTNFSFPIPEGHNEFEGRNVSFRIIVNDTLGNVNSSSSVKNFTIQINDTSIPRVVINGTIAVNGTNLSATSVSVVSWVVDDNSRMSEITVSVDDTFQDILGCNKVKNFTTGAGENNVDLNLNRSFSTSSAEGCTLLNGTHNITVRATDAWGNKVAHIHQFTVQTGSVPGLRFNSVRSSVRTPTNIAAVNNTNITSVHGLNFSSVTGDIGIANFTYISSCNESATRVRLQEAVSNASVIYPFNESTCPTTAANRTITLTVTDTAGNSNTTVFGFMVDNVVPTINVHSPIEGATVNGRVDINVSALDTESQVSTIGYYLDGVDILRNHTIRNTNIVINSTSINGTRLSDIGSNTSIINRTVNITSGTHTIKISVNDTLGNMRNSSVITFTVIGPLNFPGLGFNVTNSTLAEYNGGNISLINLTNASGEPIFDTRTVTDQTLNLFMALNVTGKGINVTLTFNASAANWNRYNFSVKQNDTVSMGGITGNFTATIKDFIWFNDSLQEFIQSNNSYYASVRYPINASNKTIGGQFEFWYFPDSADLTTKVNITVCSSGFTPGLSTPLSAGTFPCWNDTSKASIDIFVPHFSIIAAINDSDAPTLNVTIPETAGNQNISSMFIPNITTSQDAVSCKYSINESVTNVTMTKSGTTCTGQTERFRNLNATNGGYNLTFYVTDSAGNVNTYRLKFNVTDGDPPNTPNGTRVSSSVGEKTATVTISNINETVNATVYYGTAIGTLSSSAVQTDFNETQAVSLSGLSANTLYYFNVTVCDFNGNCAINGTFNLTTSAAASSTTTTSTTSSSSGGGGGAAPSNIEASAARRWDKLDAGGSAVLTINNEKIAVTGVIIDVKNAVTNAEVTVESLTSNPLSVAASAKTFQYLQLKKGNVADSDASKITINFRVPKSWLSSNNVAEGDVVLYRYSESKWNALPTTKSGADANNVLYQSTTPGFSTFAIGSKEAAPAVAVPPGSTEQVPGEVTAPTGEAPAEVQKAIEEKPVTPEAKKPLSRTAMAWITVVIIVAIAAIGYFMWQKKKGE